MFKNKTIMYSNLLFLKDKEKIFKLFFVTLSGFHSNPFITQVISVNKVQFPHEKRLSSSRKQNKINKYIEAQKEQFTQLDLQDVEVREKIKHSKNKKKTLQKQLEKEQKKVCWPLCCIPKILSSSIASFNPVLVFAILQ